MTRAIFLAVAVTGKFAAGVFLTSKLALAGPIALLFYYAVLSKKLILS